MFIYEASTDSPSNISVSIVSGSNYTKLLNIKTDNYATPGTYNVSVKAKSLIDCTEVVETFKVIVG